MDLEPSLWGTLPKELLHLVFAHLSITGIGQLRALSKEWKKNIDCKDSEFNHVFDATTHLNMFVLLSWRQFLGFGDIYDMQVDRWHAYEMDEILERVETWHGADGGLVCYIPKRTFYNKPRCFIVFNPLTKQKMQLPPLPGMEVEKSNTIVIKARIVKLNVDRKTKEYKVFVVNSFENGGGGFSAQVYDSVIK